MGNGRVPPDGKGANSDNSVDPKSVYADLSAGLNQRKQEYLRRLTTDDATFLKDKINNGVAKRRGFLKGKHFGHEGKLPDATDAERAEAGKKNDAKEICWYDDPALRASAINRDSGLLGDPLGGEDVNMAVARLTLHAQKNAQAKKAGESASAFPTPEFAPNPPSLEDVGTIEDVIFAAALTGVWIPDLIGAAFSNASALKDLTDRVKDALIHEPTKARDADPYVWTSVPPTLFTPPRILAGIMSILPRQLVEDIRSAVYQKTGADIATNDDASLERFDLSGALLRALNVLAGLGAVNHRPIGAALVELIGYIGPPAPNSSIEEDRRKQVATSPFAFAFQIKRPNVLSLPEGWIWPDWNAAGIYWWRAVLLPDCIEHLLSYLDTADFKAVDLLRFLYLFKDNDDLKLPPYIFNNVTLALKAFKYWIDEPPAVELKSPGYLAPEEEKFLVIPIANGQLPEESEMTFWSENHQILFASAQFLAGQLLPDEVFPRVSTDPAKPVTGRDYMERARPRIESWLDHRLKFGFSEWNSPVYYNEDFTPLFNLADFVDPKKPEDQRIKTKAAMVLDLLLFDLARFTCRGSFGATAGRAYWNVKAYGWEQSIGETIEVLFGARGDFTGGEPSAIALATSAYEAPAVLLAIGRDRLVKDAREPFINRSRLSIQPGEAADYEIGFDKEEDVLFWWGNGGYFLPETYEGSRKVVEAHPNLAQTAPFNLFYRLDSPLFAPVWYELIETAAGHIVESGGFALAGFLPFPLSAVVWGIGVVGVEFELEGLLNLIRDISSVILKGARKVLHAITFGLVPDDDGPVQIPDSAIRDAWRLFLIEFNSGSVLSRANLYSYCNGDAMLSSVQNHLPGKFAAQKHPWEATLGPDACVWTTAPLTVPDTLSQSQVRAWLEFFKDLGTLNPTRAVVDVALPELNLAEKFEKDGPGIWNGSVALPMVAQFENAAIIVYNLSNRQRAASPPATHAWFPKMQFDQDTPPRLYEHNGGTWAFAKKDTFDPSDPPMPDPADPSRLLSPGTRTGSGYVGLFSARPVKWTDDGAWKDKELLAEGGTNIWVCLVGNEAAFGSFANFINKTQGAILDCSGVGEVGALRCTFEIPDPDPANSGVKKLHTLELEYDTEDGKATIDGQPLPMDDFARFENRYAGPTGNIAWGARSYTISHAETGLTLTHDLDSVSRQLTRQQDETVKQKVAHRRLFDDSLTTLRLPHTQQKQTKPKLRRRQLV